MPIRRNRSARSCYLPAIVLAIAAPLASAQPILFVNTQATGTNTGLTWADAFVDLQDALEFARSPDGVAVNEIWIAEGTYKPDRATGDRTLSFEMVGGVSIYGGFAGWESSLDERNWQLNKTVLSGDLASDADPLGVEQHPSDCCNPLPGQIGCSDQACMDFVCTYGSDTCCDGGEWDSGCRQMAFVHCCGSCGLNSCENSFRVVSARDFSDFTILDGVTISGGDADWRTVNPADQDGAGLKIENANLSVYRTSFEKNRAYYAPAVSARPGSYLVEFVSCMFRWNAGSGALYTSGLLKTRIVGCTFENNYGAAAKTFTPADFEDCFFAHNISDIVLVANNNTTLRSCTFLENEIGSPYYGALAYSQTFGPGIIERCYFARNRGGACHADSWFGSIVVLDSVFVENGSSAGPGAICGRSLVIDSIFLGNSAFRGGACNPCITQVEARNSLFAGNTATYLGGAFWGDDKGAAYSTSSIIVGNSDSLGDSDTSQFHDPSAFASPRLNHNIIENWSGVMAGVGNFGADPMFIDPVGPDGLPWTGDEDLHLLPGSPAINAGNPSPGNSLPSKDADGHPRILCGRVDIGPYEFGIGDYDCNQSVNLVDFASWQSCMTGPLPSNPPPLSAGCEAFDFDADRDVDLGDAAGFWLLELSSNK